MLKWGFDEPGEAIIDALAFKSLAELADKNYTELD